MIQKIKKLIAHPLFSGSAIMIIGSNVANFFAYIYHLVIGRMLGPSGYGELASILNLVGLVSVTFSFFSLVVIKFVSASKDKDIPVFLSWINKKTLIAASLVTIIMLILTPILSNFLNVSILSLILVGPILFVSFVGLVYRSFLQGLLKFGKVIIISNIELLGRFVLGVVFVFWGFSVFGGVLGIFLSTLFGLLLTVYFLKKYIKSENKNKSFSDGKKVWIYSFPILIMSISTSSMYMSDVILTKHFFDPHLSGIYASLSTLGRIIFFGTSPISSVMFPLIAKSFAEKRNYKKIFYLSLFLTVILSLGVLLIYYLFPQFVISLLYGDKFLEGTKYLVWFGAFMTIFTVDTLILNYFVSRNVVKPIYLSLLAAIVQIILIWFFHSSILVVIGVSLVVSLILLIILLIYLAYETYFGRNSDL